MENALTESSSLSVPGPIGYEDLIAGIEWLLGKTRIVVRCNDRFIDVLVYPNYPSEFCRIVLYIDVRSSFGPKFVDLVGNGYGSGYQDKGYGRLLVNVGIQALEVFYRRHEYNDYRDDMHVCGETSDVGDSGKEPEKTLCRDRRNHFWEETGFRIKNPDAFSSEMECKLSDLKLKNKTLADGNLPCLIDLNSFWRIENRPELFQYDIDEAMKVDMTDLNLSECPSSDHVLGELDRTCHQLGNIKNITMASLVVVSSAWLYPFLNWADLILVQAFSITALWGCFFVLELKVLHLFPSYKKYLALWSERRRLLEKAKGIVREIEGKNNGLFWRFCPTLCEHMSEEDSAIFMELAEISKKQNIYRLAEKYESYFYCVSLIQKVISENKISGHIAL